MTRWNFYDEEDPRQPFHCCSHLQIRDKHKEDALLELPAVEFGILLADAKFARALERLNPTWTYKL